MEYAQLWEYAKIVDAITGEIIWHNYGYHVYQNDRYLNSYLSKAAAIEYAKLWEHTKVINGLNQEISWSNF